MLGLMSFYFESASLPFLLRRREYMQLYANPAQNAMKLCLFAWAAVVVSEEKKELISGRIACIRKAHGKA